MGIEVEIRNDNVLEVKRALQSQVNAVLEAWGLTAEGYAKLTCPVDTGRLRNSISHTHDDNTMYVGTNVEYAPYQELGTRNTAGKHFLRNSITNHKGDYEDIIKSILGG